MTRPADNNDAPPLPSAPRSCACGHPVYDDQEPRCPLCACQEHKPRFPAVCDHSAPATVSPDAGEASTGPQPELSRAVPALPTATARCYPETCAPRGTPMSGARCCRSLTEPEPLPEARTDGSAQRLAASRADGSRHPPRKHRAAVLRIPGRQPACLERQRQRPVHHTSAGYQQISLRVTASAWGLLARSRCIRGRSRPLV